MSFKYALGIDIAKLKFDVALLLPSGKIRDKVCNNNGEGFTTLFQWIEKQGVTDLSEVHVCMEATGIYWEALAADLAHRGMNVSVVNPAKISAYGKSHLSRQKTDKADARLIADYCAKQNPELWVAPSPQSLALKAMVLRLDSLIQIQTQELSRLAVCRPEARDSIEGHLAWLANDIKSLKKQIKQYINDDPDLREKRDWLKSIDGVGDQTVAVILAYFGDENRFSQARQVVAFAGLEPRHHESGSSVKGKPRMSKIGHTFIRKSLYMPAIVTLYKTAWGKQFRERLKSYGKPNMLIIGAMMRKLLVVCFGVLKSKQPFDAKRHGVANNLLT